MSTEESNEHAEETSDAVSSSGNSSSSEKPSCPHIAVPNPQPPSERGKPEFYEAQRSGQQFPPLQSHRTSYYSGVNQPAKQSWSTGKTIGVALGIIATLLLVLTIGGCTLFSFVLNDTVIYEDPAYIYSSNDATYFDDQEISGFTWLGWEGNSVDFFDDGTFSWFDVAGDANDSGYTGSYELFFGEDAIDFIESNTYEFGPSREEVYEYIDESYDGTLDTFCVLILDADVYWAPGMEVHRLNDHIISPYYGLFHYESMELANMATGDFLELFRDEPIY